jgi:hypothetical protein
VLFRSAGNFYASGLRREPVDSFSLKMYEHGAGAEF